MVMLMKPTKKQFIPDHTFDDSVKLIEGYEKAVNEADQAYTTAVGNAETAQKNADAAVTAIKENVENADNFIDDAQKKVDEAKADAETASASAIKSIEFAKAAENEYIKANDEASKANDAKTSALDELNKIIGIDGKSGLSNDLDVANGKVQENIDKVAPAVEKAEDEAKRVTDFNCELENDNPYNKPVQTAEKAVTNQIGKIEDQKKLVASKQSEIDTNNQELKKQEEIKSAANTEIINCEKKIDSADEEIGKCNTTIRKANREIFEANVAISFYGPESGYLLFGWHSTYDPEKYQDAVNKKNKAEASINDANNKIADQETIKANAKTEKENQEAIWNTADDACEIVYIRSVERDYSLAENEYTELANQYALITDSLEGAGSGDVINIGSDATPLGEAGDGTGDTDNIQSDEYLSVDSEALLKLNPDYVGWVYIPGLAISYPAVKDNYPGEYLRKTFDGKSSTAGCIFLDGQSKPDFSGYSDFLFGHNMKDGSMFAKLLQVEDDKIDIYDGNANVYVYTPNGKNSYRIFAWFTTTNGSEAYANVTDEARYKKLLNYIKSNSMVYSPGDIDFSDMPEILNLSTCAETYTTDKRFVVSCVRIDNKYIFDSDFLAGGPVMPVLFCIALYICWV